MAVNRGYYNQRALTLEEVEREERLARIGRIFQKMARVLTGNSKVEVHLAESGPAAAWSDGRNITLNKGMIDNMDIDAMVQLHGLLYHEMSHLLYTPRIGNGLTDWAIRSGHKMAYNILEDQRIETLLVGRHPSVAPYLSAVILRWLATDQNQIQSNYILVRGRRYLDVSIRQAFRDAFLAPALIPAIESIVDEYRTLVFPRDEARARVLIERFKTEVLSKMPQQPQHGCEGASNTRSGAAQSEKDQEKDSKSAQSQPSEDEQDEPQEPSTGEDEGSEGDESEGSESGEGDEDGEGEGSGESDEQGPSEDKDGKGKGQQDADGEGQQKGAKGEGKGSQEKSDPSTEQSEGKGGSGAGAGSGSKNPVTKAAEAITKGLEDISSSAEVQADMNARRRAVQNGGNDGWFESQLPKGSFGGSHPAASLVSAEKKFRQVLRRLAEDCDPGWERETSSGRLNIRRAMAGADPSEAFDRWAEGNEGADLEVFIGVDSSGSMCSAVGKGAEAQSADEVASNVTWVLTKALKEMGADVTVVTFGNTSEVVYSREDTGRVKEVRKIQGWGGTDALPALEEAERLFRSSRRKNRLLVMVTDGSWSQEHACDETMRRIEGLGVLSAVAFLDTNGGRYKTTPEQDFNNYGHAAQVFGSTKSGAELAAWGKALVTATIKRFGGPTR